MEEWMVAVILIGISALVTAMLVATCRMMGGWSYLYALATGNKEERANLAGHEEEQSGYSIYPPQLNAWKSDQRAPFAVDPRPVMQKPPPASAVVPEPIPPPPPVENPRRFSLDIARRASIDASELPDSFGGEGGSFAKLQRAMSCDSVCSDTSVVLEALDSPDTNGELELELEYLTDNEELVVLIKQAHSLPYHERQAENGSFVKICLWPDQSSVKKTQIQRHSSTPYYNEKFCFPIPMDKLHQRSLKCLVYCCDKHQSNVLGECILKLEDIDLRTIFSTRLPILAQKGKGIGELLFSLSYLPTAERLTVVLVKGRNLVWTEGKATADPFVKVYLLQKGKKISKKKTSVKKGERNPTFNEAMIFSVPAAALQNIQLRLTLAEYQDDGKTPSVGHVFVGPNCSGKQLSHWNQMISSPRKPIAMWHPLRK